VLEGVLREGLERLADAAPLVGEVARELVGAPLAARGQARAVAEEARAAEDERLAVPPSTSASGPAFG
jgi:hypothetical protein